MGKRSSGVGRGNGEGSRSTQFQKGAPSANPHGRPPTEKKPPANSIEEALARELAKKITIYENGIPKRMTQAEAIAQLYVSRFPHGSMSEQHQALRYIAQHVPKSDPVFKPGLNADGARKLVERLAEEAREEEAIRRGYPYNGGA